MTYETNKHGAIGSACEGFARGQRPSREHFSD